MNVDNDEPFIKNVESLINPAEASDLFFFSSLKGLLPPPLFRKILGRESRKFPRIGFVIEPYSLFLFFKIGDTAQAQAAIPDRYALSRAKIFADDPPDYYYGVGCFNARASTFWGSRLEVYLIARDTVTGITSWVFTDILSNTLIAHPKTGIASPNCGIAMHTTNAKGELFLDFREKRSGRALAVKGRIGSAPLRPLDQDLWIMGNTSIAFGKGFSGDREDPFAVIFDPAEVKEALDIPPGNIQLQANTLLPEWVRPEICKVACFPYAQHYIADSPGCRTSVKNPEEMVDQYRKIAAMHDMRTFSAKTFKLRFFAGVSLSLAVNLILILLLMLRKGA